MPNIAIKAENLSKAYQLGQIGTGTISRDLERWYARIRGKEDPFLKIGETNDRTSKGSSDIVWSLKDINFEIEQGDAVGIIGRNGAGKSTLLKVLSRVTSPTTGRITGKGRIASLLEVGTGFHPELTGRENIYLNGAILGMRKKEITRKFDEIVDFAGVERYIDTPVKRYSSGMYVRLAFAVAAHLESEILIVDEVLAVGDAEFQKKCLGKMGDVSKGEGRTVLFVSHNMISVETLCKKGIFLDNGTIIHTGNTKDCILQYKLQNINVNNYNFEKHRLETYEVKFTSFKLYNENKEERISSNNKLIFELELLSKISTNINIRITVFNEDNVRCLTFDSNESFDDLLFITREKKKKIECHITEKLNLKADRYFVNISIKNNRTVYDHIIRVLSFEIQETDIFGYGRISLNDAPLLYKPHEWRYYDII
ncbi:ABC transporter ATP-binding protein [Pseudopedobacter beijingensis]|uniref:ABC transporter ATP-binding protein n=1 Tax=Pseudopedobacter beijingensis TaxID=1207056 RepID=A0ABW4I8R9_9SPHI